jgi:arylsulfatase
LLRGISLKDNLLGERGQEHDALFWEHEKHAALRQGKWKIVSDSPLDEESWELYDMHKDRTETKNLSTEFPEIRAKMISLWTKMAHEMNVLPYPNPEDAKPNPVDKN